MTYFENFLESLTIAADCDRHTVEREDVDDDTVMRKFMHDGAIEAYFRPYIVVKLRQQEMQQDGILITAN